MGNHEAITTYHEAHSVILSFLFFLFFNIYVCMYVILVAGLSLHYLFLRNYKIRLLRSNANPEIQIKKLEDWSQDQMQKIDVLMYTRGGRSYCSRFFFLLIHTRQLMICALMPTSEFTKHPIKGVGLNMCKPKVRERSINETIL